MPALEFNMVHDSVADSDVELLLGPFEPSDGPFIKFDDSWTMAHVMHAAGIFKSVSEARKNGWNKPIPIGYSHHVVSKRKINVFVLNRMVGE